MAAGDAAVFRVVLNYVPHAVRSAAGWVGGLGALAGFALPPLLRRFIGAMALVGYALGLVVYVALAPISLALTRVPSMMLRREATDA